MGITGIRNVGVGRTLRSDVRGLYDALVKLTALPDGCPRANGGVGVGPAAPSMMGIMTFGSAGASIRAVTFGVRRGSLAWWRTALSQHPTRYIGRAWQFDEEHLCFVDESGFDMSLVEIDAPDGRAEANGILGLRGVEVADGPNGKLENLLRTIGMEATRQEGPIVRYEPRSGPSAVAIDVFRTNEASLPQQPVHAETQRISFELGIPRDLEQVGRKLRAANFDLVPICDRTSALAVSLLSKRNLEIGFVCVQPASNGADHG